MSYTIQPEDHRLSYISTPRYEYMSSTQFQPPAYSSSDAAGSVTGSDGDKHSVEENSSRELMKINEHLEVKEENYYSTWRGVLAGISTFTILEIFRKFFF